jgi:hypothetical protein
MRAANLRAVETLITRSAPDEVVVPQGGVAAPYSSKIAVRRSATSEQTLSALLGRVMIRQARQNRRVKSATATTLSRARCLPFIQRRRQYFGEVRTCAIHHCDSLTLNQQGANYGEYGRSSQHRPMVTECSGIVTAQNGHISPSRRGGYSERDVNLAMSDETRRRHFPEGGAETELGSKAAEGAGVGGAVGATVGAIAAAIAAVGTSIAIPGAGARYRGSRSRGACWGRRRGLNGWHHRRTRRLGHSRRAGQAL